jgi:hypothetical protein
MIMCSWILGSYDHRFVGFWVHMIICSWVLGSYDHVFVDFRFI